VKLRERAILPAVSLVLKRHDCRIGGRRLPIRLYPGLPRSPAPDKMRAQR
jgi:hypothetical protein